MLGQRPGKPVDHPKKKEEMLSVNNAQKHSVNINSALPAYICYRCRKNEENTDDDKLCEVTCRVL